MILQWPVGALPLGYVIRLRKGQLGPAMRPLSGSMLTVTVASAGVGSVATVAGVVAAHDAHRDAGELDRDVLHRERELAELHLAVHVHDGLHRAAVAAGVAGRATIPSPRSC